MTLRSALRHLWLLLPVVKGQIRLLAPGFLVDKFPDTHGIVYGTTATFGAPDYGERVLGQLLYGESRGNDHCDESDYDLPHPKDQWEKGKELVNVVLVRRGKCTFVTKVRVAADKGAHAVIVVDKESSQLTSEQIQNTVMADDGTGDDIRIPSILISRFDGQELIDAAKQGPVVVELAWDIPQGEVVVADFWMSSGSREAGEFLQRFKLSAQTLQYHLQFVPHYHVFQLNGGPNSLCLDTDGKYCAPRPDTPDNTVSGGDVVAEDLRQLCLWNATAGMACHMMTHGATYSQKWWDYVQLFWERCSLTETHSLESRFGERCSYDVMASLDVDVEQVMKCVAQRSEELLEEQLQNVAWSPQALRLNGWRYSGPLDPQVVLKAVCSGYATPLKECKDLQERTPAIIRFVKASLTYSAFVWIFFFMAFFLATLFWMYRRHVTSSVRKVLREEVMLEVQTQMADYAPLQDGGEQRSHRVLSF